MLVPMKRSLGALRQFGASLLARSPLKNGPQGREDAKQAARPSPLETAAAIELFLLDSHRLLTVVSESPILGSNNATFSDWLVLRELRTAPFSLPLAARRLRLSKRILQRQLQRLVDLGLATTAAGSFELSAKGEHMLQAFTTALAAIEGAGSSISYKKASKLAKLLQRRLLKPATV